MPGSQEITDGANPILGLIGLTSLDEPLAGSIAPSSDASPKVTEVIAGDTVIESGLNQMVQRVNADFTAANTARIYQEQQVFMRALLNNRASYNVTDSAALQQKQRSQVFLHATRPRVQTAVALLMPILCPPGDDAWTVDADPGAIDPDEAMKLLEAGTPLDQIRSQLQQEAGKKSDALEGKIAKGLDFTQYPQKMLQYVFDLCIFGTGILMGPFAATNPEIELSPVEEEEPNGWFSGLFKKKKAEIREANYQKLIDSGLLDKVLPVIHNVSPFEFYPDPGATSVENSRWAIVRKVFGQAQILEMLEDESFRKDQVQNVLATYPDGVWTAEWWETTMDTLNKQPNKSMPNGRYTCYQWWGFMRGSDLRKMGVTNIPEDRFGERVIVNAWVIGNVLVKCAVSDLHKDRLPFYVTPYSYVPHCMWGIGPSELMFDTQDGLNAMFRAMFDNLALASGPQMIVVSDRLLNPDSAIEIRPWKIWPVKPSEAGDTQKPIEFFTPESRLVDIRAAIKDLEQLAQEQTALPNFLMGGQTEGTHNRTAQGASMQFQNALTPLKTVIFNVESTQTVPMITNFMRFFQTFSKDPRILGKFKVGAHGVRGLMAKEALLGNINNLMQAAGTNPAWSGRLKIQNIFTDIIRASGDANRDWVYSDEEYAAIQKQQQEAAMNQTVTEQAAKAAALNAPKQRAEESPRDAMMEFVKQAPDNSSLKLALTEKALNMWGVSDPKIQQAIEEQEQMLGMGNVATAHKLGAEMGDRHSMLPPGMEKLMPPTAGGEV